MVDLEDAAHENVNRAEKLLQSVRENGRKPKTICGYKTNLARLIKDAGGAMSVDALLTAALNTTKAATWNTYKATLVAHFASDLYIELICHADLNFNIRAYGDCDTAENEDLWIKLADVIETKADGLQKIRDTKLPLEGRAKRHSKKQDMKGLPDDWRERVIARMPSYRIPALVAAVTGCRSSELESGIELKIDLDSGNLVAKIVGAKVKKDQGQPWRRMYWQNDNDSPLIRSLFSVLIEQTAGESFFVQIKSATNFSTAMRDAAEREWKDRKSTVTPYCFRHQASADMKSSGLLTGAQISAALGHMSDITKSTYGHPNMGRKAGNVSPIKVEAARPVLTKALSKAAAKRMGNSPDEVKTVDVDPSPSM